MSNSQTTRNKDRASEIIRCFLFAASIATIITLKCIFDPAH